MNLIRGSHGFLGSRIKERFNCVEIPRSLIVPKWWIKQEPKTLFYCAGYGNMNWQTEEEEIRKVNFEDLIHLFSELPEMTIVYFSTSNGNPVYLKSKRRGEALSDVVIRPYSVTGVGEQKEHLIPIAIDCAFTGKTLTLDPNPVHDFIDIEDLLDALDLVKDKPGIYEVGRGRQVTNKYVIELIEEITKKKIHTSLVRGLRAYDKSNWCADISKLEKLGWKPKKSLKQSITEQINDYKYSAKAANIGNK